MSSHFGAEGDDVALNGVFTGAVTDQISAGTVELRVVGKENAILNDGVGEADEHDSAAAKVDDAVFDRTVLRIADMDSGKGGFAVVFGGGGVVAAEHDARNVAVVNRFAPAVKLDGIPLKHRKGDGVAFRGEIVAGPDVDLVVFLIQKGAA